MVKKKTMKYIERNKHFFCSYARILSNVIVFSNIKWLNLTFYQYSESRVPPKHPQNNPKCQLLKNHHPFLPSSRKKRSSPHFPPFTQHRHQASSRSTRGKQRQCVWKANLTWITLNGWGHVGQPASPEEWYRMALSLPDVKSFFRRKTNHLKFLLAGSYRSKSDNNSLL